MTPAMSVPPGVDEADLRAAERLTRTYEQMTRQLGRVICS